MPSVPVLPISGHWHRQKNSGALTRKVLQRLGYSDGQIARVLAKGALSESWSAEYLPG